MGAPSAASFRNLHNSRFSLFDQERRDAVQNVHTPDQNSNLNRESSRFQSSIAQVFSGRLEMKRWLCRLYQRSVKALDPALTDPRIGSRRCMDTKRYPRLHHAAPLLVSFEPFAIGGSGSSGSSYYLLDMTFNFFWRNPAVLFQQFSS